MKKSKEPKAKERCIVIGFSRMPNEISNAGKTCEIVAEIVGGKIQRVEVPANSELLGEMICDILKGVNLTDPAKVAAAIQDIESKLQYRGKKAVLAAFRDVVREYLFHYGPAGATAETDTRAESQPETGKRIIVQRPMKGMVFQDSPEDEADRIARSKANRL